MHTSFDNIPDSGWTNIYNPCIGIYTEEKIGGPTGYQTSHNSLQFTPQNSPNNLF